MQCVSKIELRISCENLILTDISFKSDPCCVLEVEDNGIWIECGRTEQIQNTLHPKFIQVIPIDYYFEKVQNVRLVVYDVDDTADGDFLGHYYTTVGHIVSSSPLTANLVDFYENELTGYHGKSTIKVLAEEVAENNSNVLLTFRGHKLDKKDFIGKSDPFLEICKLGPDAKWYAVAKTEVIKNTLDPQWRPLEMSVQALCAGDYDRNIQISCYDWDYDGGHDLIGIFHTTVREMLTCVGTQIEKKCINAKKAAKKKSYDHSGLIFITSCQIVKCYSFLDFIFGGLQINFTVGIDFTGSNGDPASPNSLHYINPNQPNEYIQAITSVGKVCQDYDTDMMFPALGFGAKLPNGTVSHEFPINFNTANPHCCGVAGIVEAYKNCVSMVKLWGPTNFSPIIYHVSQFAAAAQKELSVKQSYYILLIITDGVITDMDKTRDAIVYASSLPMSIIICGVGSADFTDMNLLDGDDGVLRSTTGEPVCRDIVQFVPFRKFAQSGGVGLAQQVLAEVPHQVTDYFKKKGIVPFASRTG